MKIVKSSNQSNQRERERDRERDRDKETDREKSERGKSEVIGLHTTEVQKRKKKRLTLASVRKL